MDPLLTILTRLLDQKVDLVLVGGMAAIIHGSPVVTHDIDFCIPFDEPTMERMLGALRDVHPTFRQRPDRLPLWNDPARLAQLNFLLVETTLGNVDFIKEVAGIGGLTEVAARSEDLEIASGVRCKVLTLDGLIVAKRAVARRKDLTALHHLEAIQKSLTQSHRPPPSETKTPDSDPPPDPPV